MEDRNVRTGNIRIKVTPEMLERVERQANAFCMPVATICAFAVGDWVQRQENQLKLTRMAVLDASRRGVEDLGMTDERMDRVLGPMLVELVKQHAEQGKPVLPALDPEEPRGS